MTIRFLQRPLVEYLHGANWNGSAALRVCVTPALWNRLLPAR